MKQTDLIRLISKDTGIRYEAVRKVLRKLTKYMCVALENEGSFRIGVGTFSLKATKEKQVTNFQTGERYTLPPKYKIMYLPSIYVKRTVRTKTVEIQSEWNNKNGKENPGITE